MGIVTLRTPPPEDQKGHRDLEETQERLVSLVAKARQARQARQARELSSWRLHLHRVLACRRSA